MKLSLFNIHDVALLITVTLCLLLAMFRFLYPEHNRIAKYFLVTFLIDIAIGVGAVLLLWQPNLKIHPFIDSYVIPYILFSSLLLKGPLLYGYVSAATTQDYRFSPFDIIHLTPIAIYFSALALTGNDLDPRHLHSDPLTRTLSHYEWHSLKIIPLIYALMAVHKVRQYHKQHNNHQAHFSSETAWLDILAWGTLFNWSWSLGTHVLGFYLGASIADKFGILDNYITSGLISALLVYSLVHTNKQLATKMELVNQALINKSKINRNPISNGSMKDESINDVAVEMLPEPDTEIHIVEKIIYCMEVEKLFLNPRLNIERMAEHINAPYREVSALINKHFHMNFNEYVNLHRINEAKRLLADAQLFNLPICEIYTQAGFNSKSAFHRFFSRLVGVSPTEFRKLSAASIKTNRPATA